MKTAILAGLAAVASAQTVRETFQECYAGQGGYQIKDCRDIFYYSCAEYEVYADERCNIYTFSDSRLQWTTSDLSVFYWEYYEQGILDRIGKDANADGRADSWTTRRRPMPNWRLLSFRSQALC